MTAQTPEMSADLPCHRCGYDLRAHPQDAKCPECGESVAESRRLALIPRRPAWQDSDPRWRRRMLAGAWVLAFMPLIDVLQIFGWPSSVPVPTVFPHAVGTLDQTFLCVMRVDQSVLVCIGVVPRSIRLRSRKVNSPREEPRNRQAAMPGLPAPIKIPGNPILRSEREPRARMAPDAPNQFGCPVGPRHPGTPPIAAGWFRDPYRESWHIR